MTTYSIRDSIGEVEKKTCSKCQTEKSIEDFFKDRSKRGGRGSFCKLCAVVNGREYYQKNAEHLNNRRKERQSLDPEKHRAYFQRHYKANKDRYRNNARNRRYSLTSEKIAEMLAEQDNKCAICREEFTGTPRVDHDHNCCPKTSCGKCVRGLLCNQCNAGIGMLKDSQDIILRAAEYVISKRRIFE